MKRFIALVLSLVMALSLCVPAWGEEAAFDLQGAIDNAKNGDVITLAADFTGDVTVTQKEGVKFTIDGNNHKFYGTITVNGKSARYATAGVTIQNVNFEGVTGEDTVYINLGVSGNNDTRYTNNVAVKNCTFTSTGNQTAAVKSYTGGDWNVTLDNCIVNSGMHSLAQLANVEQGLMITNCKVYSKNGANLNQTPSFEMSGCTFDVQGYAVRVGVNGTVNTTAKTFNITDSTLKSACAESDDAVIVFRDSAKYAALNLTDTTLTGDVKFLGNIDEKTTIMMAGAGVAVDETTAATPSEDLDLDDTEEALVAGVTTSFDTTSLTAAANTKAENTSVSADVIEEKFATVNPSVSATDVEVVVNAYYDVEITAVDTTANEVSITLDITPMYQVVANDGTNYVEIEKAELDVGTAPVEITIDIPDALAELAATKDGKKVLYVNHKKDGGPTYVYEAVVEGTAGAYTATFTNPNGFSLFTLSAASNAVASVNGTNYTSLTDAITAAASAPDKTVTLLKDVTVAQTVVLDGITLDGAGHKLIADAALGGMDVDKKNDTYTVVKSNVGCTIKNLTIKGGWKGILINPTATQDTLLENVTVVESCRGINFNNVTSTAKLTVKNSTLSGWSGVQGAGAIVFENTKFVKNASVRGSGLDTYDALTLKNCTFDAGTELTNEDLSTGEVITINGGSYACDFVDKGTGYGTFSVVAGTFSTDVSKYAAPGVSVVPNGYGSFATAPTANVPTSSSSKPYFTTDFVNFKVSTYCDLTNYKYELRNYYNGSDAAKMFDKKVIVAIDEFGGLTYLYECVVATSKDSATLAFVNGTQITYLNTVEKTWDGKVSAVTTVEFDDVEKCGDVFTKNDVAVYTNDAGDLFVEDMNGNPYNVGGKLVLLKAALDSIIPVDVFEADTYTYYNNVVYTIGHDYDYDLKSVNGKQSVTRVFCADKDCKKDIDFVAGTEAQAIAKFNAGNYLDSGLKINGTTVVWVAKDAAYVSGSVNLPITLPSVGGTTGTITSADTFDAGIAMYVGMSVMAAAGSAVVIGKKKD